MSSKGKLYLIPNLIANASENAALPAYNIEVIKHINFFICEHAKPLRALLKASGIQSPYNHIEYFELNKHTSEYEIEKFIEPLFKGIDMGLVSDAGCPGIADPGAQIVDLAHKNNIEIAPLVGPSSLLLALMGSGLNGQNFTFNGYLPAKEKELKLKIQKLEIDARKGISQIFIEAPYRNQKMIQWLLKYLTNDTKLCIAYNLMANDSYLKTKTIAEWHKEKFLFEKNPAVFIIGC
ncbi:MAG: SAM-dependent methyltransferase [Bacteroidia bacterium]